MLPSPMRVLCVGPREDRMGVSDEERDDPPHDELHLAVLTGRTKRIKNLLRKGVHIESVNSHGQTPLFCASFGGDNEVVSLLLRLGANPNRRCGGKGATPVHGAAYRGSRRVLRLLVEAGGDLAIRDYENQTPREYALKQPSPIRRQKILSFLDLLLAMTLHRSLARGATLEPSSHTLPPSHTPSHTTSPPVLKQNTPTPHSSSATLPHAASKTSLALKRQGSLASVWGACVTDGGDSSPRSPPYSSPPPNSTLTKTVSCHMLEQMYVSTSLPLLTPADLHRPDVTGIAYTCGGPTVYSPYTWLGTKVTVRRPTPALSLPKNNGKKVGEDRSALDPAACKSLLQELSVLRRLRHPGFLEVMAACHVTSPSPDHVTLVFQHVQHGSLYHHLHVQHRDLSVGGAVEMLVGVVEALIFLHAHNWLHTAVTSHSLHLVSTHHAKLGGFEFAMEMHGKGCSMRAPQLTPASWLGPWQAPETLTEQMVSTRSEVYSLTAVIWEVWAGMPPWSGVEEKEVRRRVEEGETLPTLTPTPPSLITYLTQYGLKWNSHERELDLQEIHTMLRSLKIQSNEEERVPVVPAWGPPSVPNTPVIGRHSRATTPSSTPSQHSSSNSTTPTPSLRTQHPGTPPLKPRTLAIHQEPPPPPPHRNPNAIQAHITDAPKPLKSPLVDGRRTSITKAEELKQGQQGNHRHHQEGVPLKTNRALQGVDSGFSTPCTRTPSPNLDTITSAKINPSFLTSTPARHPTTCILRADLQPDLLPNKMTFKPLTNGHTPDILQRHPSQDMHRGAYKGGAVPSFNPPTSPVTPGFPNTDSDASRPSSPTEPRRNTSGGYGFVSNAAKRAFLMESDTRGGEEGGYNKGAGHRRGSTDLLRRNESIIRRGLSLTNISVAVAAASYNNNNAFPRTASHVSLASASSSGSSDVCSRRPIRTISQVTLTMRKLSHVSDSSSSKDEVCCDAGNEDKTRPRRTQRSTSKAPRHTPSIVPRESPSGCHTEDTAIKPASHQVTRHSSSCSLASGPSSPTHYSSSSPSTSWVQISTVKQQLQQQQQQQQEKLQQQQAPPPQPLPQPQPQPPSPAPRTSIPPPSSSPPSSSSSASQHASPPPSPPPPARHIKGGVGRRWNSVSGTPTGLTDTAVKIQPRRLSEGARARPRRGRRRHEMEVEEEFFDDEFNASLFQQPHMQLSVGSSENLLDSRAPHSMLADGAASPASLGLSSSFSPSLTSSEDEEDEVGLKRRPVMGGTTATSGARWRRLGAVKEARNSEEDMETGKTDEEDEEDREHKSSGSRSEGDEDELWRFNKDDFGKDFEPLKSVQLLRNLRSLSLYLPSHTIASDTDPGEM